jgi:hypothetical protein
MQTVIVHINNEEPIECEVDHLPTGNEVMITLSNPRLRDGKDLHYLDESVTRMMVPVHRINFIQIMPSAEADDIISFVRED